MGFNFDSVDEIANKDKEFEEILNDSTNTQQFLVVVPHKEFPRCLYQHQLAVKISLHLLQCNNNIKLAKNLQALHGPSTGTGKIPMYFNCKRPGHIAANCPTMNNLLTHEAGTCEEDEHDNTYENKALDETDIDMIEEHFQLILLKCLRSF